MQTTPPVMGTAREWAMDLAFATVVGGVLGVLGPFGSYFNGPVAVRVVYWVAQLWFGMAVMGVTTRLALHWACVTGTPRLVGLGAAVIVGSAPVALGVGLAGRLAWGVHVADLTPVDWYMQVVLISAVVVTARVLLWPETAAFPVATPLEAAEASARLSDALRGDVLCLQMEDHYVRVHTPGGSRLVLGALGEAMAALRDKDGLRVHRSWWVARAAVERAVADGRAFRLELSNGLRVPVSRASVANLRAAGWLR